MSKYIIEIPDDVQYVLLNGQADNKYYTAVRPIAELEILNSDYINEHYGSLQDEAYQRGFEDGRRKARGGCTGCKYESQTGEYLPCDYCMNNFTNQWTAKPSDRIEVGDEVRAEEGHVFVVAGITDKGSIYGFDKDGMWLVRVKDRLRKTGKHYDIQSILEAMRE